ncbi:MAG: hypothetical protein DRI90_23280, partial [Deltaproteobacteria bacterium]
PTLQVHQASISTDAVGSRHATLLFNAGTQANIVLPDGSVQPASSLDVRVTEFTVGEPGPQAMPGELPPTSQYTYAVELSADEAIAAGATVVEFDQPFIFYVENYYGHPVGTLVPAGQYDRQLARWVAITDGIIIKILAEASGKAVIDFDGDDIAEGQATFDALGVTQDELEALAQLYEPGDTLWRTAVEHFSTLDCNFAPFRNEGECVPNEPGVCELAHIVGNDDEDGSCTADGSIIECQNQILGEAVSLSGTPFSLHYQSDRATGRKKSYELTIPLVGDELPIPVQDVILRVRVAGREYEHTFPCKDGTPSPYCAPHSKFVFNEWDGRDHNGRLVQGPQPATVRVGYTYNRPCSLNLGIVSSGSASGGGGGSTAYGGASFSPTFATWPSNSNMVAIQGCDTSYNWMKFAVWASFDEVLGPWMSLPMGLGGFSISPHHGYSPATRVLYRGDGSRRTGGNIAPIIETFAGGGLDYGDGGLATDSKLQRPAGMAVGPDGSIYVINTPGNKVFGSRVRVIDPNGIIHTVAGTGVDGDTGDGGLATDATLRQPWDVALGPDGSLYIPDSVAHRVRRVAPDGTIHAFAGTGVAGFSGDGGQAVLAQLWAPRGIAVSPQGIVYIAERLNGRIRAVYPNGIIDTVAGGGASPYDPNTPKLAVDTRLAEPVDVAIAPDGSLYVATVGYQDDRVYRVSVGGMMSVAAGTGGPATAAEIDSPDGIAVGDDGSLYIVGGGIDGALVRRVSPDGMIHTVVGGGDYCNGYCGEGGPATAAYLWGLYRGGIVLGPDGSIFLTNYHLGLVYRVRSVLPGLQIGDFAVPSADGSELYLFDAEGRHEATRDALLGTDIFTFDYSPGGLLQTITDIDGRTTSIVEGGTGDSRTITGPYGHESLLGLQTEGYAESISNPMGEAVQLTYHLNPQGKSEGLLKDFIDAKGNTTTYGYDPTGLLTKATRPSATGGFQDFVRTDHVAGNGRTVTRSTALGRVTTYVIDENVDGSKDWAVIGSDGLSAHTSFGADETVVTTLPDGTEITRVAGPDPRYGMLAPVPTRLSVRTGGKTLEVATERVASLSDPNDPTSI